MCVGLSGSSYPGMLRAVVELVEVFADVHGGLFAGAMLSRRMPYARHQRCFQPIGVDLCYAALRWPANLN